MFTEQFESIRVKIGMVRPKAILVLSGLDFDDEIWVPKAALLEECKEWNLDEIAAQVKIVVIKIKSWFVNSNEKLKKNVIKFDNCPFAPVPCNSSKLGTKGQYCELKFKKICVVGHQKFEELTEDPKEEQKSMESEKMYTNMSPFFSPALNEVFEVAVPNYITGIEISGPFGTRKYLECKVNGNLMKLPLTKTISAILEVNKGNIIKMKRTEVENERGSYQIYELV